MKLPVQRSDPVMTMAVRPHGKIRAAIVRISPGAFFWNHGAALVLSVVAHAKERRNPALMELKKTLSQRVL
jgi:hypothetical protein